MLTLSTRNPAVELATLLKPFNPGTFDEKPWRPWAPRRADFAPERPALLARMLPGATGRHERRVLEANRRFDEADAAYKERLQARAAAFAAFEAAESDRKSEIDPHNKWSASCRGAWRLKNTQRSSATSRSSSTVPWLVSPNVVSAEVGYAAESRHLVIDLDLPERSIVPKETGFRYVKLADRIEPIARPEAKRKALYANLLCQVALKGIDTVFRGGHVGAVECLTLNGMLDTIDPATGQNVRVCLLSVRITADDFRSLNLTQVQPEHCLRSLKASVSRAPAELLPVKPLLELDMVDPRFVATLDIMSGFGSPSESDGALVPSSSRALLPTSSRPWAWTRDKLGRLAMEVWIVSLSTLAPSLGVRSSSKRSATILKCGSAPSATSLGPCRMRAPRRNPGYPKRVRQGGF